MGNRDPQLSMDSSFLKGAILDTQLDDLCLRLATASGSCSTCSVK